jgi:hypothetical protein
MPRRLRRGDFDTAVVYTGEAIDRIHSIEPAEAILRRVIAGAETALARRFDGEHGSRISQAERFVPTMVS